MLPKDQVASSVRTYAQSGLGYTSLYMSAIALAEIQHGKKKTQQRILQIPKDIFDHLLRINVNRRICGVDVLRIDRLGALVTAPSHLLSFSLELAAVDLGFDLPFVFLDGASHVDTLFLGFPLELEQFVLGVLFAFGCDD